MTETGWIQSILTAQLRSDGPILDTKTRPTLIQRHLPRNLPIRNQKKKLTSPREERIPTLCNRRRPVAGRPPPPTPTPPATADSPPTTPTPPPTAAAAQHATAAAAQHATAAAAHNAATAARPQRSKTPPSPANAAPRCFPHRIYLICIEFTLHGQYTATHVSDILRSNFMPTYVVLIRFLLADSF